MLLWVVLSQAASGGPLQGLQTGLLVCGLFLCVYLHELGHALAATRYRIATRDITLLPFGGVAQLERMPSGWGEVIVALAGPAVNVLIAALLFLVLLAKVGFESMRNADLAGVDLQKPFELGWVEQLLILNVGLVLFNLVPAFPLDGGRVLRGLLSLNSTHLQATQVAARIGRYLAFAMIGVGIFYNWSLALVGLFVLFAGTMELMQAQRLALAENGFFQTFDTRPPSSDSVIDADDVRQLP